MSNNLNTYLKKFNQVFAAPISLFKISKRSYFYAHVGLGTFLAFCFNISVVACPESNIKKMEYEKITTKTIVETSDGRKFSCWHNLKAKPIKFQGATYDVAIHCDKSLTIYSQLDGIDNVVVDNKGSKSLYQAEFLGDKYECNTQRETMIKPWIYKRKANVIKHTVYQYTPYKS
ncbi:hypothetical protein NIES2100_34810 [Calothrix sp. NIES-2100]|uniref:hypothetical protein n=1 Tax=Calothrix sp. NIES-2100 TaxID=1954172 RepID=UPI000B60F11C|nr:hypothetical protein NIES2100_34810 [Calothrix sp. NIES-2100]